MSRLLLFSSTLIVIAIAISSLSVVPTSSAVKKQRNFIEATSKLGSYKLPSKMHPGLPMLPTEIRMTKDRTRLVALVLSTDDDAYKAWESILDISVKLNAAAEHAPPKALVEVRTLAMLSEAAIAAQDVKRAAALGNHMIATITILRKRAASAAAVASRSRDDTDSKGMAGDAMLTAAQMLPEAEELGWKTCYQIAKQTAWDDHPSRIQFMGHVLALCPKERISSMTRKWHELHDRVSNSTGLEQDLFFAKAKGSAAKSPTSSLGSLMDAYATPFASLLANAGSRSAERQQRFAGLPPTPNTADSFVRSPAPVGGGFGGRAAQLFDVLGGAEAAFDPAERAARAAKSFFGGITGRVVSASAGSGRGRGDAAMPVGTPHDPTGRRHVSSSSFGGGTFSFSKGVGWLLGEEEQ
ncbi:hypothetical protein K437DRAFT_170909 [Tilletiaria anomala UBC 951]|uniref:Sec39 domain-containing protein n=1 Tax=Tilletiaria anomala (strain ATCC 24038 / CBS 436.72 / UBC 951) TaxID=1037660 RepID=A0A066VJ91_TILAU|nr:uncharacterized protein K437DRAFT_170909 [Tilletiaria anomala UBC 951]KDN41797.1 hypothetical protein K437DRAFT_170909 [Tilletiaria anomala UBC 951]